MLPASMAEPQAGHDDSWVTQSIFSGFVFFSNACYSVFHYGDLFACVLPFCGEKVSQICDVFSFITSCVQNQVPLCRSTTAVS